MQTVMVITRDRDWFNRVTKNAVDIQIPQPFQYDDQGHIILPNEVFVSFDDDDLNLFEVMKATVNQTPEQQIFLEED